MSKKRSVNQLVDLFSKNEREEFRQYLKNYTNEKQLKISQLYECIYHKYPIEKTWNILFPDVSCPKEPFSQPVYRKLEFQLTTHIESYLAQIAFAKDQDARDLYLMKALNDRKAGKLFDKKFKKIQSRLERNSIRDESYFKIRYFLERENQQNLLKKLGKSKNSITPVLDESFNIWWMHEKLFIALNGLNHKQVTGEDIDKTFLAEVLSQAKTLPRNTYPVLHAYRLLFETLSNGETHENLHDLIYSLKGVVKASVLKDLFVTVLNHYGNLFNTSGQKIYLKKLYELYKWGIEDRLIFIDGVLMWAHYKNFATIGLRLNDYDNTLAFIEDFKKFVPQDHREETYRFTLAHYYFTQADFPQVVKLLNWKFSNVNFELQGRLRALQAHYELSSDLDFSKSLRALRVFISRQKLIPNATKKIEIEKIRFFEKLVKAYNRKEFDQLKEQLPKGDTIGFYAWMMEKVRTGLAGVKN